MSKPKSSLTKIVVYRVEVEFCPRAWELFGHSSNWDAAVIEATQGCISAGSERYSFPVEWAEFDDYIKASEALKKLEAVAEGFKAGAEAYDAAND